MKESSRQQQIFMKKAIALGSKGRFSSCPNPWVGSLLVKKGKVIGQGIHHYPGQEHAEVQALKSAEMKGESTKDSEMYVTLEPCCHYGRTPPCTQTLIDAGIKKIFIGTKDPDSRVYGKGIELLRRKGINVVEGFMEKETITSLLPYLHQRLYKKPFVVLKLAVTLDGKIGAKDGSSQWVTGALARKQAHLLRAESQAIVVGADTVIKDNPLLTTRVKLPFTKKKPLLRVIMDSLGRVPLDSKIFNIQDAPTLFITTKKATTKYIEILKEKGVEVIFSPCTEEGLVDIDVVMENLSQRGVIQVLVEGGAKIATSFLKKDKVDLLTIFKGNCLLGGDGKDVVDSLNISNIQEKLIFNFFKLKKLNEDIRIDYLRTPLTFMREALK